MHRDFLLMPREACLQLGRSGISVIVVIWYVMKSVYSFYEQFFKLSLSSQAAICALDVCFFTSGADMLDV